MLGARGAAWAKGEVLLPSVHHGGDGLAGRAGEPLWVGRRCHGRPPAGCVGSCVANGLLLA